MITTDKELRSYFPNVFSTALGEVSFLDRLSPFLASAREWIGRFLVSSEAMESICAGENPSPVILEVKEAYNRLLVARALHAGAPQLDLALTANGFVTTQTESAVPISSQRMDRLLLSLQSQADDAIEVLLYRLRSFDEWLMSPQAEFFRRTTFQNLSFLNLVTARSGDGSEGSVSRWRRYCELTSKIHVIERRLEEEVMSPELMAKLRHNKLVGSLTFAQQWVVSQLQPLIIEEINTGVPVHYRALAAIVNHIKENPDQYPEWHESKTARLFDPPVFENKKNSGGYFF